MASVPLTGNVSYFDDSNSIHQVLVSEFSYAGAANSNAIISWCKSNVPLARFHPQWRPSTIGGLSHSSHFRGFPVPQTDIEWLVKDNVNQYL